PERSCLRNSEVWWMTSSRKSARKLVHLNYDPLRESKMHIVTFYSFKGGTGRSMALVNVAVEMVKSGLRVLVLDFDLQAPGLDTFNLTRPQKATKGIVDLVLEYLETGQSPDVSEFIYKSPILTADGQLWVMPAGTPSDEYDSRFKSIDWRDLYANKEGYLL